MLIIVNLLLTSIELKKMYQVRGPQFYSISGLEVAAETANVSDDGRATMQMQANANTLPFGEPTADYLCLKSTADGNCLYNSISFLLKGNELASDKLRRDTARELQNHLDVYFESMAIKSHVTSGFGCICRVSLVQTIF